jgi:hypothetical protein
MAATVIEPILGGVIVAVTLWVIGKTAMRIVGSVGTGGDDEELDDQGEPPQAGTEPVHPAQQNGLNWVELGIIVLSAIHLVQWYRRRQR